MFDHKNFALNGLYPGLVTTRSVANLGHFEIEVIITPPLPDHSGGGGGWVPGARPQKWHIKIKVTRKGKVWEYESDVNKATAKVAAKLLRVKIPEPTFVVEEVKEVLTPEVKVSLRNKS